MVCHQIHLIGHAQRFPPRKTTPPLNQVEYTEDEQQFNTDNNIFFTEPTAEETRQDAQYVNIMQQADRHGQLPCTMSLKDTLRVAPPLRKAYMEQLLSSTQTTQAATIGTPPRTKNFPSAAAVATPPAAINTNWVQSEDDSVEESQHPINSLLHHCLLDTLHLPCTLR